MKEAFYYEKLDNLKVRCLLCPQFCVIENNKTGLCNVRKNINGTLFTNSYENIVSIGLDPIEKKPLFHFYPNSQILSTAFNGCNLKCNFCQNWSISQDQQATQPITADSLILTAKSYQSIGICFTYTEPFIGYEFILDVAKKLKAESNKAVSSQIVLVTNGFINPEPLKNILPYIDAMNIDLKAISSEFYRNICKGKLEPILETIKLSARFCHIEITNLIIPTLNDTESEFQKITDFIANINPDIPLHFSKYYPSYKSKIPATSDEILHLAYKIASQKLNYVYVGNTDIEGTENTYCPKCKNLLIERHYYTTKIIGIEKSKCDNCGRKVDIIGL